MQKILLITRGFPIGNHEKGFLQTEYQCLKKKYDVLVLAILPQIEPLGNNTDVEVYIEEKIKTGRLLSQLKKKNVIREIFKAKHECGFIKWLYRCKAIVAYCARAENIESLINTIVEKNSVNLIYTYWCTPATVAALRIKEKNRKLKVITRFHGFDLYADRNKAEWQVLREYIASNSDGLFFACNQSKNYFIDQYHCAPDKAHVAYLGTDKREIASPQNGGTLKLISCSTTKPEKRVEMIAKVVELIGEHIDVEWLHIGGDKLQFGNLDNKKVKYCFSGQLEHDKVIKKIREYNPDLFITLSCTEGGVPVTIQETYSMGIPALGTNTGGIPEIIEQGNGILVDMTETCENIANKVINYYSQPVEIKKQFSQRAFLCWNNRFNAEINAESFMGELEIIMGK